MDTDIKPKISICIPVYEMPNKDFFIERIMESIRSQSFRDFEIVVTEEGKMAENTNAGIKKAKGEIIKILYMDDFLAHTDALQEIVDNFKGGWLVTGCEHSDGHSRFNKHYADYNENIHTNNTIGSPSVLAFENKDPLLFDETLTWMLDCDLYKRLHDRYGKPTILDDINVVIGVGNHQTTHILSDEIKNKELEYLKNKYDTTSTPNI